MKKSGPPSNPAIAVVANVPGWALDNIAKTLRRNLGGRFAVEIFYADGHPRPEELVRTLFSGAFDLVHFLWRENFLELFPYLTIAGAETRRTFAGTKISFSVYDHLFLDAECIRRHKALFSFMADGYAVSSERLQRIYSAIPEYPPPLMVIEDGVDLDLFHPVRNNQRKNDPVIIGWAGNSRWGRDLDGIDHKGLHTLIRPAIASLRREGVPVVGRFADSVTRRRRLNEMAAYYNAIDIYVCASDQEGTPNPVLEAMSCGLPVVSTDVGIVPQLFGPLQQAYIVRDRSVPAFAEHIRRLAVDPALRAALGEENLRQIATRTRASESVKWQQFFEKILQEESDGGRLVQIDGTAFVLPRRELKLLCLDLPYAPLLGKMAKMRSTLSWRLTEPVRRLARMLGK